MNTYLKRGNTKQKGSGLESKRLRVNPPFRGKAQMSFSFPYQEAACIAQSVSVQPITEANLVSVILGRGAGQWGALNVFSKADLFLLKTKTNSPW